MQREEAIQKMNKYGKKGWPFFFVIDFLQKQPEVILLKDINTHNIQFRLPNYCVEKPSNTATDSVLLQHHGYSQQAYHQQIEKVIGHINRGDSFLVNLTCETKITLNKSLPELYKLAKAKYKLLYNNQFVVFSPETFVTINKGEIATYPMKGTIDATIPDAATIILQSPKEKAEHYTIVDLLRNDLSQVAENVRVTKFRYIDQIETDSGPLLQVSSEIKGDLPADYTKQLGNILFTLLPAGSISGAPKAKTVAIIEAAETYQRDYYTGVFGVFDGQSLDSAVMIRFIQKTADGFVYKSGGGITAFSKIEEEYQEMLKKIYVPIN